MKNLLKFLQHGTPESSMRLMALRIVNAAFFLVVFGIVGVVAGFIVAVVLNRDMAQVAAVVGGIMGGMAGVVGALLVPAFGGKAAQKFAEKGPEEPPNT